MFFTDVAGPAGPNRYRLDKQFIDPSAFQAKTRVSMTLIDSGNQLVQRTFLSGVTVQSAVPEPASIVLLATGAVVLGGLDWSRRRRAATSRR